MKLDEQQHNLDTSLLDGRHLVNHRITSMVPTAYAGGDDGNKNKAEDESQAALPACNDNNVEQAGFDCVAVAEIEEGVPPCTAP
jgi:hypothetical protein